MITTTPTTNKYEDGGLLSKAVNTAKKYVNPRNWGLPNYSDKPFGEAFSTARGEGRKNFLWNDNRYSANMAGTPQEQLQWSGITNERLQNRNVVQERLSNNLRPRGYENPFERVKSAVINNQRDPRKDDVLPARMDAFNLYTGKPQVNNTFSISDYTPSISQDENTTYYKLNNKENQKLLAYLDSDSNTDYDDVMGNYKLDKGEDERGKYLSYYDKWDLNPLNLKNPITGNEITADFGKPFEIYDRIYYTESPITDKYAEYNQKTKDMWVSGYSGDEEDRQKYMDEIQKLYRSRNMYYSRQDGHVVRNFSDKELMEIDPNNTSVDVLKLQNELINRGYELPNSIKENAKLDGIFGEETKNALLEYQKSRKRK